VDKCFFCLDLDKNLMFVLLIICLYFWAVFVDIFLLFIFM